jgi:hypothetical protein
MLEKLTYNQKGLLLLIALVLFFIVGYGFTFSDTIVLIEQIDEKEKKITWLKEKEKDLPVLKQKMAEFEKAYTNSDSSSVRDKLTAYISAYADANNCLVTEIPLNTNYKNSNLKVQTNTFTVKGGYKTLVSLLHLLELDFKYVSKTMSAKFYTVKEIQTKKRNLYLTIITQSFEQKIN